MHVDAWELAHMAGELGLGVTIKLFCDNGRVHWKDLVNDLFFWVPGVTPRTCDGLRVQIEARESAPVYAPEALALAAK